MNTRPKIALTLVEGRQLPKLVGEGAPTVGHCRRVMGWPDHPFVTALAEDVITQLRIGNEFCETLLPAETLLATAVRQADAAGLALALVTPVLSDDGLARLAPLLGRLPAGSEVVGNDLGVLRYVGRCRPDLRLVAGRLLCKMIKDPRLPSATWAKLYPHGVHSPHFAKLLARLGVGRLEMDVPPFADATDFRGGEMAVAVHVPYGFAVRGRTCKIGSLHAAPSDKFAPGEPCRRECLAYGASLRRPGNEDDLPTFQRGHTIFYAHSSQMSAALATAVAGGSVDRLILPGDWNEDRRAD